MGTTIFRGVSAVMTALLALGVLVQYNDPDPIQWMAIYGAACVLSALVVARRRVPIWAIAAVGIVAVLWGALIGQGAFGRSHFAEMFESWEMKAPAVEEAREAWGLMIIAAWMAVLAIWTRAGRR
jgi:phosphatidylserine synthase